jgi:hypothetical protein
MFAVGAGSIGAYLADIPNQPFRFLVSLIQFQFKNYRFVFNRLIHQIEVVVKMV